MNKSKTVETKTCNKCGRILSIDKFRLIRGKPHEPYYLGQCKECEYTYQREYLKEKNKIRFSDNLEILIQRQYKEVKRERILDISSIDIELLASDEIFVRLMDYKRAWLSNYGRVIVCPYREYNLLKGFYDSDGSLCYKLVKNVFSNGKWNYKRTTLYAAKAVIEEFVVNPDKVNNTYTWHRGFNKRDCYYKNLYPLNQEQYRIVKKNFNETGDDAEGFILKVMNDIRYKPDDWSRKAMEPVMCGIGYRGSENVDCTCESYLRWHDMLSRCYNAKFHERQPQYKGCKVCVEWLNYMNFKVWYDSHKYGDGRLDVDKDILYKGNTVYSPETAVLVPHEINTLLINCRGNRGDLPVGVYFDKDRNKYRAEMNFMGKNKKLGRYDTPEEAFAKYKEYKEKFIKDIAEKYIERLPFKVYEAMMSWEVEITD